MRFLAIDLETTGLNPSVHGVIEVGAVYADLDGRFVPKQYQAWVIPDDFTWSAFCLNMHAKLIQEIHGKVKDGDPMLFNSLNDLGRDFKNWLNRDCGVPYKKTTPSMYEEIHGRPLESVVAAGKNFGSFDLQFLLKAGSFRNLFKHRSLDPTHYYIKPEDEVPPDLKECKLRAGFTGDVAHRGLSDAWDVVDLLQRKFKQ